MISLARRIVALEHAGPTCLPLDIRAWLGDHLTAVERASLASTPERGREGQQSLPVSFTHWLDQRAG